MASDRLVGTIASYLEVVQKADDIDYQSGVSSYAKYNTLMRGLASKFGCTVEQATAVFVSTSPNNDYIGNLRSAVSILDGWKRGVDVENIIITTYNHCRSRAWACLHGVDFLESAKGPKIRSFYRNIVDPLDLGPVTIDGHMVSAWVGRRILMKDAHGFKYEAAANDARALANQLGLVPCQLQGIIWFTWKRIHQVVYNGNLNIFGDHWGLDIDPTTLKPYTRKITWPKPPVSRFQQLL